MLITDTSVKHKTTVFVLTIIIIISGLFSYYSMPREAAPEVVIPNVFVQTNYRGVSPEDMENSVTKEIEDKLKGLKNVKKVTSTSKEGSSLINIEFVTGTDIDDALQKVKDKIDLAKAELPTDLDDDPSVFEVNFSEMPILIMTLSGKCGLKQLRDIAEDLEESIEGIPGVLEVDIVGGKEREIHIEVSPERMALYGVPFTALSSVVSGENANISGGSIKTGEGKYQLRLEGEFKTAEEAEQIIVMSRNNSPVYLRDIAEIKDSFKDMDSTSRFNGYDSVNVYVKKRAGENIIRIIDDVEALLKEKKRQWPSNVEITSLENSADEIHMMVSDLENNIISGLILVIVVVCIAMGLRNAFLVSLSIPLSMLLGFIILKMLGITLNMVVLFSLTLSLGMLVDNAIVIIENIYRFMQEGVGKVEAAMKATSEVAYPIIGSGLTTIAAFAPMVFWGGVMGGFMSYLPKTVIVVLASCLFVALVINPAMASVFMKADKKSGKTRSAEDVMQGGESPLTTSNSRIIKIYSKILSAALGTGIPKWENIEAKGRFQRYSRHLLSLVPRFAVLSFSMAAFIVMIMFWVYTTGLQTPTEFFPEIDPKRINVTMDMPEGVDLSYCNKISREIEKCVYDKRAADGEDISYETAMALKTHADVFGNKYQGPSDIANIKNSYTRISSLGDENEVSFSFLDMQDRTERSIETVSKIKSRVTKITGAKITVERPKEGPPTGAPINIEIVGEDLPTLGLIAGAVKDFVRQVPFTKNIKDDYKQGAPTLSVKVNRKRAALLGLNSSMIGFALKSAINGTEISTYREGDDDFDIIMRLTEADRHEFETLEKLFIPTSSGMLVPLSTIVEIEYTGGLGQIERVNYDRVVTVQADVDTAKTTGNTARMQAEAILKGSPLFTHNKVFSRTPEEAYGETEDFEGLPAKEQERLAEKLEKENIKLLNQYNIDEELLKMFPEELEKIKNSTDIDSLTLNLNNFIEGNRYFIENRKSVKEFLSIADGKGLIKDQKEVSKIKNLAIVAPFIHEKNMKLNRKFIDTAFSRILMPIQEGLILPPGYSYRFTGEEEHQKESAEFLSWAGSVAIALIFMILVSQFNSVLYPFIIMTSVILSLAGVFLGLGVCNMPFGIIMTGVGVISLAGVVVNNAIVLIDYIIQLRERGMERDQAIMAAGATRLRPVLLTAITTVLGLIPMATGISFDFHPGTFGLQTAAESSQWWQSMAIAVIFGLGVATLLTLIIVPVLFSLLDDLHNLTWRLIAKSGGILSGIHTQYWLRFWRKSKITPTPKDPCYHEYMALYKNKYQR